MSFRTTLTIRVAYRTIINTILHRIPPPALPKFTAVKSFCDNSSEYLIDKIETARSKCPDKVPNISSLQKREIKSKIFKRTTGDTIE